MNKEPHNRQEPLFAPDGLAQLRYALIAVPGRLAAISRERAAAKLTPESWSAKEELGHLIDSAANNHQRIVRAQLEDNLALPGYDGDQWVELHGYQNRDWTDLITLWRAGNSQLLAAAEAAPDVAWSHTLSVGGSEPMTLGFVLDDYVDHMASHLRHIGVEVDDILASASSDGTSIYPEKPAQTDYPINDLMRRRWSPRAFEEGRPVEREKVLTMLEAARWAPSCFNDQPRCFLVFDGSDEEALERARTCLSPGNAWALNAPVLMLSVARETFEQNGKPNRWAQHDTGLATENLLLEAVELGLAAHPMAGYDADRARSEFGIPEGFTPIAMIAIGYPYRAKLDDLDEKLRGKELAARERKSIGEIAFAGIWNAPYDE
ncbi:MAG TPA: nitroreductase family protein [Blastocatellia bacterium]|nr:nitroreductase family protein [Blastocatellia bacterium]